MTLPERGAVAEARWRETWALVGSPAPAAPLAALVARYGEPHRTYHDLAHVLDCLGHAAEVRGRLEHAGCVELALWFHDAVYDPRASDNEARSAELASRLLAGVAAEEVLAHVCALVLATRHPSRPADHDARYVVDVDLSILGAPPAAFAAFERAVRQEYAWVPEAIYRRERARALRSLLELQPLYLTAPFAARYEETARANLRAALARLAPGHGL